MTEQPTQQLINAQKELLNRRKRRGIDAPVSTALVNSDYRSTDTATVNQSASTPVDVALHLQPTKGDTSTSASNDSYSLPSSTVPQDDTQAPRMAQAQRLRHSACKVYPSLSKAFLGRDPNNPKRTLARVGAGWYLFKANDIRGSGKIAKSMANDILRKDCGLTDRMARGIIKQGMGITWYVMGDHLYLFAPDRVSIELGAGLLTGRDVYVPYSDLCGGIQQVKSTLLAAFHAGRRRSSPMTRQTIRNLTNVPERTQQIYDKVAGVTSTKNIASNGDKANKYNLQRHLLDGRPAFKFYDHLGKHFRKRTSVIAWRLPNSYDAEYLQAPLGRRRKYNERIDLVSKGVASNGDPQGNGSGIVKTYHPTSAIAARHASRNPEDDHYYPVGRGMTIDLSQPAKLGGADIWRVMG